MFATLKVRCRRCRGTLLIDADSQWGMPPLRPRLVCINCARDNLRRPGPPPPVSETRKEKQAALELLQLETRRPAPSPEPAD